MPASMVHGTNNNNNNVGQKRPMPDDFVTKDHVKRAVPDAETIISAIEFFELLDVNKGTCLWARLLQLGRLVSGCCFAVY